MLHRHLVVDSGDHDSYDSTPPNQSFTETMRPLDAGKGFVVSTDFICNTGLPSSFLDPLVRCSREQVPHCHAVPYSLGQKDDTDDMSRSTV